MLSLKTNQRKTLFWGKIEVDKKEIEHNKNTIFDT